MQKQCPGPTNKHQTFVSPAAGGLLYLPLFNASRACSEVPCLSPGQCSGCRCRGFSQRYSVLPGKCKAVSRSRQRSFISFEAAEISFLNNLRTYYRFNISSVFQVYSSSFWLGLKSFLRNGWSLCCRRYFMTLKDQRCISTITTAFISCWPPLWSSGQSSWLQIQRPRVRFPALLDFLRRGGSGTGSTQPREDNWGATWNEK
jgi:hypothetical protein